MPRHFVLVAAILLSVAAAPALAQQRLTVGRVSLCPSPGWTVVDKNLPDGMIVAFLAPAHGDGFRSSLSIWSRAPLESETPSSLLATNARNLGLHGGSVQSATRVVIDRHPAGRIVWTTKRNGESLRISSTYVLAFGQVYVFTYMARIRTFGADSGQVRYMLDDMRFVQ